MLHLRNINPMMRAVGTMGAVAALVGGITFAQLTSNTVALSPNTLSTGSANLEIGSRGTFNNNSSTNNTSTNTNTSTPTVNNNSSSVNTNTNTNTSSCRNTTNGTIPGFNLTGSNGLLPGVQSSPLYFCLKNASSVPLDLTVAIPDDPFASATGLTPDEITLNVACGTGNTSDTLDVYNGTTTIESLGTLGANSSTNCQATVRLSNTATVTGTESLPSFDIEFTGTTTS